MDRVHYGYQPDRPCVRDLSMVVHSGEMVALMGANGSGKSTVARLAIGLLQPDAGTVTAGTVAYVAQDPEANIVGERVDEDVAFGLRQSGADRLTVEERVRESLDVVGMAWASERTMATLSGGEMQRVAIAAALAGGAELIVFDEPTSHLDHEAKLRLWQAVTKAAAARRSGLLYITHAPEEALRADRVIVLGLGREALYGPPEQVLYRASLLTSLGIRFDPQVATGRLLQRYGHRRPQGNEGLVGAICSAWRVLK